MVTAVCVKSLWCTTVWSHNISAALKESIRLVPIPLLLLLLLYPTTHTLQGKYTHTHTDLTRTHTDLTHTHTNTHTHTRSVRNFVLFIYTSFFTLDGEIKINTISKFSVCVLIFFVIIVSVIIFLSLCCYGSGESFKSSEGRHYMKKNNMA